MEEGEVGEEVMATRNERSKSLYNFMMPKAWGNQKLFRCLKVDSTSENHHRSRSIVEFGTDFSRVRKRNRDWDSNLDMEQRSSKAKLVIKKNSHGGADNLDGAGGIDAVREKLMLDLRTAADNMKFSILKSNGEINEVVEHEQPSVSASAAVEKPWNLRTRRASCKFPINNGKNSTMLENRKTSVSSLSNVNLVKSTRLRVGGDGGEKKQREKFSIELSRKEIGEDYLNMIGAKPPRKPKKRPKTVQKQLDKIFPGLWLTEVTPDMYKV